MSEQISENGLMAVKSTPKVVVDTTVLDTTQTEPEGDGKSPTKPYQGTDWKKRYDDLRRYQNQQIQEWKDREKELNEQVANARPKYSPPKTKEELEEFQKTNPDIYAVAESLAHLRVDSELSSVKKEISDLVEAKEKTARELALVKLEEMHPDFKKIRVDPIFKDWAAAQPKQIQDWLFKSTNPTLTAKAISLFKMEHIEVADKPGAPVQEDTSAADAVATHSSADVVPKGQKIWTQQEIANLSDRAFQENLDEINAAQVEGRVRN